MASSAQQLRLPSLESHRNHYLFSDYYLKAPLPQWPEWHAADAEAGQALLKRERLTAEKRLYLSTGEPEQSDVVPDLLAYWWRDGAS